ncbi:uncharacterized protein PV07_09140 [Cladophialophora immunda]|uniref:Uncharacterized protein n=1 Tax=Cladophialophora immunda TaxID=569365 RepID=A0A0D2C6D1_9EURO|nr:uncharacterized protein PV07_09140 [Cladophialophora immunda]KIW26010.1 hypothetical protein PV07_09140 [Cladophialophora immunda]
MKSWQDRAGFAPKDATRRTTGVFWLRRVSKSSGHINSRHENVGPDWSLLGNIEVMGVLRDHPNSPRKHIRSGRSPLIRLLSGFQKARFAGQIPPLEPMTRPSPTRAIISGKLLLQSMLFHARRTSTSTPDTPCLRPPQ